MAQAQLDLDQDELDDAKEDLSRSGADPLSRIQRQLKRHKDTEHGTDAKPTVTRRNCFCRRRAYLPISTDGMRCAEAAMPLQQADDETVQAEACNSAALMIPWKSKSTRRKPARARHASARRYSRIRPRPHRISAPVRTAAVTSLRRLSDDQKNLSDLDKRIQDRAGIRKRTTPAGLRWSSRNSAPRCTA